VRRVLRGAAAVVGRSAIPFSALAVIGGTVLWGPWVSLALALALWNLAKVVA